MIKHLLSPVLVSLLCLQTAFADPLADVVAGDQRSAANTARDIYRNPVDTLKFFDIQPNHTVVEISPGGGWYTEILAPYLRADGLLYAAHFPAKTEVAYYVRSRSTFLEKLEKNPAVYDKVQVTEFGPGAGTPMAPPGSA